jgi:hypothetical protein
MRAAAWLWVISSSAASSSAGTRRAAVRPGLCGLRAKALTAKPLEAADGGKQRGVQVGSVTEADIGGRQY